MLRFPAALLLAAVLLAACVPAPCAYNPGATCYAPAAAPGYAYPPGGYPPPPAYPPPAPAYPPPGSGQAYIGPDGLTYSEGYPVTVYDGAEVPYIFLPDLGGWGYYDNIHRWHGAPPNIRQRLDHDHPGGRGLPPPDRFRPGPGSGPGTYRPTSNYPAGEPGFRPGPQPGPGAERGQLVGRPPGGPPVSVNAQRPALPRQEGSHLEAPRQEAPGRRACPANQPNC